MTKIEWNDSLLRHIAFQDADHQEAVELMNAMQDCADDELPGLFAEHFAHIRAHFTREHELMERTGFFAYDCHAEEHMRVLDELKDMQAKLDAGDIATVRAYVTDTLPDWFLNHLATMDQVTAQFARQHGES